MASEIEDALGRLEPGYGELFARAQAVLEADARVEALYLAGSLGRGAADGWSDLDLLVLAADDALASLGADLAATVDAITPTVIRRVIPAGPLWLVVAVTPAWLRLDLAVEAAGAAAERTRPPVVPVFDRREPAPPLRIEEDAAFDPSPALAGWIEEFWRVLGLAPAVLGRGELAVAVDGAMLLRGLLVQLLCAEAGRAQQAGVKRLNERLPPDGRALLEGLPPLAADRASILAANAALAEAFLPRARALASRHDVPWPEALEAATRAHLRRALSLVFGGGDG